MTEWTQEALRAEAQKRVSSCIIGAGYSLNHPIVTLVAELIGRCEEPPLDPFLEMWKDANRAWQTCAPNAETQAVAVLRERVEGMIAERMGK